jgi:ankyrin repeat protein
MIKNTEKGDELFIGIFYLSDREVINEIKKAVKNGANVNLKDINGDTAIIIAIGDENEEISEFLIKSGANTNDKDSEGRKLLEMTESSAFRKKLIKLGVKW